MTKTESIISDIYDAWRAQDLEWLASYLPQDFSHMVYIPKEIHPLGGLAAARSPRSSGLRSSPANSTSCASIPAI
jgi:hypothetical protein